MTVGTALVSMGEYVNDNPRVMRSCRTTNATGRG